MRTSKIFYSESPVILSQDTVLVKRMTHNSSMNDYIRSARRIER